MSKRANVAGHGTSNEGWSVTYFVLAGTLLGIIGVCIEAAIRRRGNRFVAGIVASLGVVAAAIVFPAIRLRPSRENPRSSRMDLRGFSVEDVNETDPGPTRV